MKIKKLLLATFAVALFATASAQDLTYGVKVGINVASLSSDGDSEGQKSLVGLHLGATAAYSLDDKSAISAELLFSQQGAKWSESYDGDEYTDKYKLSYLNIPIMYNYYVIDKLAVKAGIQPGFLLSSKYKWEVSYDGESESGKEDLEGISGFDFAIPIGVSYDVTDNIAVELRYNIGVSNIYKDSAEGSSSNNVFAISAAYKF